MPNRKNIFLIGRRGHEGDENQLTEMLAWLFQQEPKLVPAWLSSLDLPFDENGKWRVETQRALPGGFLDLVLSLPGRALVILESKLGSTTDFDQISKYIDYAKSAPVKGTKALIFTTQHPEPWPPGVADAAGDQVTLVLRRWQALGGFLRDSDSELAHDFVAMMEMEGLVTPDAITAEHWEVWQRGNEIARRLGRLIDEAASAIQTLEPGFSRGGSVVFSTNGLIYRLFHFTALSCGIGFFPAPAPTRSSGDPQVVVYALNTALPERERKAAGHAAVEKAGHASTAMSGWSENYVQRSAPAREVLTAADFDSQVRELVAYLADALLSFKALGYLERG